MSSSTTRLAQLTAVAVLTLAMAACSSPKKPLPIAAATTQPPPTGTQQAQQPRAQPPAPRAENLAPPRTNGPVPGSLQDFLAAAGGERVFFDYDSSAIRGDAAPILDAQASWLARYPPVKVRIEGNADERGTREYNFALGAQRANAVKVYLVRKGVSSARVDTVSYGKERPIDTGDNEQAWARNRNGHTALTAGAN
jgi:peptidoglycan-associated lipoprotein